MTENTETNVEQQEESQEVESKTYTQAELDKLLQAESDRRVTQARQKFETDYAAKLEDEKNEAAKLAKLSEEERFKEELRIEREKFEAERKEFQKAQLEAETIKQLSTHKLPTQFAQYLVADDAETIQTNIAQFSEHWSKAIDDAINQRLKGSTPKATTTSTASITKEQFKGMSLDEKMKLFNDNPDLYHELK